MDINKTMRKPSRPPPPPPLPPRGLSPTRSCCSMPQPAGSCASGSEFSDSVQSMPSHRVLMRQCISPTTSNYHSCASEVASCHDFNTMDYNFCPSCYITSCNFQDTCCKRRCSCTPHHPTPNFNQYQSHLHHTLTPSRLFNRNLSINSSNQNNECSCCVNHQTTDRPTPKARTTVPKIERSESPLPMVRNKSDYTRSHYNCEPLFYIRHVEQHVQRIFKYLKDRERRRQERLDDIARENISEQNSKTFIEMLKTEESLYLRSMRTRISKEDFQEIQELGTGAFGNVWLVEMKSRGESSDRPAKLFAMKKLKRSRVVQENVARVIAERDILAEAHNEWIVKLYYSFQDSQFLYFILEYIPGGDMMNLLIDQSVFSENWARFYITEISLAVQFVHNMGFVHRDIKPDNILIDADGHIKLTDFGLCTGNRWTHDSSYYKKDNLANPMNDGFEDHPTITKALTKREIEHSSRRRPLSLVGSPNYISPEVLRQSICKPENTDERLCDWWSVGVILYEMVIGYCPFIDLEKIKQNQYNAASDPNQSIQMRILNWRNHLAFPSNDPNSPPQMADKNGIFHPISESTKNLIRGLLCDPQDRLCQNGIRDIMDHPFFHGIDWENVRSCKAPFKPKIDNELDTRHFQDISKHPDADHQSYSDIALRMPINDFTYRSFYA